MPCTPPCRSMKPLTTVAISAPTAPPNNPSSKPMVNSFSSSWTAAWCFLYMLPERRHAEQPDMRPTDEQCVQCQPQNHRNQVVEPARRRGPDTLRPMLQ